MANEILAVDASSQDLRLIIYKLYFIISNYNNNIIIIIIMIINFIMIMSRP